MAAAIPKADEIDPLACRRYVEERFSSERMVHDYENAYELALKGGLDETSAEPQSRAGSPPGGVLGRART
jgi:hypothetical protein